ncbi:hypothetical protein WN51_12078 [Melipona quadrifasciata]|uniref:Uncharacterized protein n=1 Tax=Melipona quadrifasciata TaxID=166423 RepID=A0A0N0U5R6_9HYME|nr:hypothetical protein WN51_12078 [Melipona quadrifasciata]
MAFHSNRVNYDYFKQHLSTKFYPAPESEITSAVMRGVQSSMFKGPPTPRLPTRTGGNSSRAATVFVTVQAVFQSLGTCVSAIYSLLVKDKHNYGDIVECDVTLERAENYLEASGQEEQILAKSQIYSSEPYDAFVNKANNKEEEEEEERKKRKASETVTGRVVSWQVVKSEMAKMATERGLTLMAYRIRDNERDENAKVFSITRISTVMLIHLLGFQDN